MSNEKKDSNYNKYRLVIIDKQNNIHELKKTRSVEELDSYTVNFDNKKELVEDMLINFKKRNKKEIQAKEVKEVYILLNEHSVPIMYRKDNFNYNDLLRKYEQYVLSHKDQIAEMDGLKFVGKNVKESERKQNTISGYGENGNYVYIPDNMILYAIDNYLMSDYKKLRDAYFNLKSRQIKVKIDPIEDNKSSDNINRDEILSLYDLDDLSNEEIYFDGQGRKHR